MCVDVRRADSLGYGAIQHCSGRPDLDVASAATDSQMRMAVLTRLVVQLIDLRANSQSCHDTAGRAKEARRLGETSQEHT